MLPALMLCLLAVPGWSAQRQRLHGHVPAAVSRLAPVGRPAADQPLRLAVGLPLRDAAGLTKLLAELHDPASPNCGRYLTPAQFADRFGPNEQDYQAVIEFAKANGLTVAATHPNRVVLDLTGSVATIEKALRVTLRTYQHPREARRFFAPDGDPSLDLAVVIADISGLDDYALPHPHFKPQPAVKDGAMVPYAGSAPGGGYAGYDFRAAYVPGTSLTGTGQSVALLQFDGYYASDIAAYRAQFNLPGVPLINVPVNGGVSIPGSGNTEVCLDIEMAMSMAPGLAAIYVYEAPNPSPWVDLLSRIANDNLAKQISCSWGGGGHNATAETLFQQMAAQGQSFFTASGDAGAYTDSISFPADSPNITVVGGTRLTTSGGAYVAESVWNSGGGFGSGGGVSTYHAIPGWQVATSMATNQGSTTMRNIPDVALTASNVYVRDDNGSSGTVAGTSCAAPLWAGFTALVNQQALANGRSTVGFLNPLIYSIGNGAGYRSAFRDTATGNNFSTSSPTKYAAVTGYDLCTGWGTPNGTALIAALSALAPPDPLQVSSPAFAASGQVGGPFAPLAQTYTLTNNGGSAMSWTASKTQAWTALSATAGTLAAGASTTVTWTIQPIANTLAVGGYADTLLFTNTTSGVVFNRGVTLRVGQLAWDGADAATAGAQGGSGSWGMTAPGNWWNGTADEGWPASGTNNDAYFGGAAGTVTLAAAGVTANDLTFTADGYLLSGAATLTLNGTTANTLTTGAGISATIGNNTATVIAGTSGLAKMGAGTLTLSGSAVHPFTGGLNVYGGLLVLDFANLATPADLIDAGNPLTLGGGGTLSIRGKSSGTTHQAFGNVTVGSGGGQILGNVNGGSATRIALGSLTATTVGGSLLVGTSGATVTDLTITTTGGPDVTGIYGGRMLFFNGTANTGYDWATATGAGPYTLTNGSGYVDLDPTAGSDAHNSRISASATLAGSRTTHTLKIDAPAADQSLALGAHTLTLDSGGLLVTGSHAFTIAGTAATTQLTAGNHGIGVHDLIVHQYNTGGLTVAAVIGDNGTNPTALTKSGTGTLIVSGSNTYTGGTWINGGVLQANHASALGNGGDITFGGGTLQFASDLNQATVAWGPRLKSLTTAPITLDTNSHSVTLAGSIASGNTAGLTKSGAGTLTLNTPHNYTGPTVIGAGTLKLLPNTLPVTASLGLRLDAGKLSLTNGALVSTWGDSSGNNRNATGGTPPTFVASNPAFNNLPTVGFNGSQFLNVDLTFLANNAYTIFAVTARKSATVPAYFLGNSTATEGPDNTILQCGWKGNTALTLSQFNTDLYWLSAPAYTGTEVACLYGAKLDTSAGHFLYYNASQRNKSIKTTALATSNNGTVGKVQYVSGGVSQSNFFTGDIGEVLVYNTALTDVQRQGVDAYLNTKWGLGLTGLPATGGDNLLPTGTNLTISAGASLDLGGSHQQLAALAGGSGTVHNTAAATSSTLTLSPSDGGSQTFPGAIAGGGGLGIVSLTMNGTGTQVLAGTNTYTGATTVKAGTLRFATPAALYNSTAAAWTATNLVVAAGGTAAFNVGGTVGFTAAQILTLSRLGTTTTNGFASGSYIALDTTAAGGTFTYGSVLANSNAGANTLGLTKMGAGTLVLSQANTYTGATTISAGTLQLGSGGTTGSLASGSVIVNNGILAFNRSNAVTQGTHFSNAITGAGGIVQAGSGTLTLTGSNTYAGDTTVSAGTLVLNAGAGLQFVVTDFSNNRIAGTGTLTLNGGFSIDTTAVTVTSGSWQLVQVETLGESYGAGFAVLGTGWMQAANVWTRVDGLQTWTFNEATGVLALTTSWAAPYATWAGPSGYNLTGAPGNDDDGDGMSNFQEFAFGLNPTTGASLDPIRQQLDPATGRFKYTRRATPATTGLAYTYEWSATLGNDWFPFTPVVPPVSDNAVPVEAITVEVPAILLTHPRLFLRVKAQ